MCTTPLNCEPRPAAATPADGLGGGSFFLAVDGYTGPAWDGLNAEMARVAYALVQEHLSAASQVGEVHVACAAVPVVSLTCRTAAGEAFTVATSPTGHVEAYRTDGSGGDAEVVRAAVDGAVTVALYERLVGLLGAPTRDDSLAAA